MTAFELNEVESAAFVTAAIDCAVKASAAKISKAAAVELSTPIIKAAFERTGLKPWGDDEWAKYGKCGDDRKKKIQEARNTMIALVVNGSHDYLAQVGTKLGCEITSCNHTTIGTYIGKCAKSTCEGELKTIQNLLSEVFGDLGYALLKKEKKALTAEAIAKYLTDNNADLGEATTGLKYYAGAIEQDVNFSCLGGMNELVMALGEMAERDNAVVPQTVLGLVSDEVIGEHVSANAAHFLPKLSVRDVVMYVAGLSAQQLGEVLGVEGAEEFAEKIAGAFYPVA